MNMEAGTLLWGLLFGSIGFVYWSFGKKRKRMAYMASGAALVVFPYAVSNTIALVAIGVALMLVPRFIRE